LTDTSISVVVPMFNIARYLPDFLDSLDAQTVDLASIEFVFVDDGSTDDSAALVSEWIGAGRVEARLIRQDNAGPAAARNRGLAECSGAWVTFPDPDDRLNPSYFETIQQFLRSEPADGVHLVAANLLRLNDETGRVSNRHPLRFKFAGGQRVVDLETHPRFIHLHSACGFYRRATIEASSLAFDLRIRPNFEDAHFTALYLATFDKPRIAVVPDAVYLYRERADGSSLIQSSWSKPEKYTDLLEYGFLALLLQIRAQRGTIPRWTQMLVVHELAFFFNLDSRPSSPTAGISRETSERFHDLLRQIMACIDVPLIEDFSIVAISDEVRAAMLMGAKGVETSPASVQIDAVDAARRLVRVWYYYARERPTEQIRVGGVVVTPAHQKIRAVRFLGQTMIYQRIAWVPATGTLAVELDGARAELMLGRPTRRRYRVGPRTMWHAILHEPPTPHDSGSAAGASSSSAASNNDGNGDGVAKARRRGPASKRRQWRRSRRRLLDAALIRYARSPFPARRYRDAWLLIDRDDQAQDNAERLYSYLRQHEPDVNAWFVLSRDSQDWDRLRRAGFRLLEYQSRQHTIALLNCRHLISSHIDQYIVSPLPKARFGQPGWRYTFLQHGVTKDDLSVWINPKPVDLMITAGPDEHKSIVGDGTPYVYTTHEVVMTGFPRHDRLRELAEQTPVEARRLILVAPTWRRHLAVDRFGAGNNSMHRNDFWQTEYAVAWRSFLESESLRAVAEEHGWEITFVPHPNVQDYLDTSPLSDQITVHRFRDVDIQALLARTGILVTDYSSMAFEAAYLQRPVVYFQFDQAQFFDGNHAYRRGTWDYEASGFGPVTSDVDAATKEVELLVARGGAADDLYAERMAAALPLRDGKCCRRTYEAIRAREKPQP
jgi:glycosyltransferase involved in cell wall biosynthesis/CDP-glycerol glycerophosphotransferase (TagB/SpsB family)